MHPLKTTAIIVLAIVASAVLGGFALVASNIAATDAAQASLDPFYTPPGQLPAPGNVIRSEPLGVDVAGGTALRLLYSSSNGREEAIASSAMVFLPDSPAPATGRPIVAWAHGTVGQGDACAPSRSSRPLSQLDPWLTTMLQQGWIVVATDYAGLGTPGVNEYLVGEQEARDVIDSVRAVRELPNANAGTEWAVFGHSQGGHAALWTGQLAKQLAPDLALVGVAAAAPSAELGEIVELQWDQVAGWVIGVEVAVSWPQAYPGLELEGVVTRQGLENYERLAQECVVDAALESYARYDVLKERFFARNPLDDPTWQQVIREQTPKPLPASVPVFLAQGTLDTVVYPEPNVHLFESWCAAGSTISGLFVATDHLQIAKIAAPEVITWLVHRFNGDDDIPPCKGAEPVGVVNQTSS